MLKLQYKLCTDYERVNPLQAKEHKLEYTPDNMNWKHTRRENCGLQFKVHLKTNLFYANY